MRLGTFHFLVTTAAVLTQMLLTLDAVADSISIDLIFKTPVTLLSRMSSACLGQLIGKQQFVDKEVVGQVSEASRWNHKVGPTEWTGQLVSRPVVVFMLAVLEQTLETERVHARQHFGLRERLPAYRTLRDVTYMLRPTLRCGHDVAGILIKLIALTVTQTIQLFNTPFDSLIRLYI